MTPNHSLRSGSGQASSARAGTLYVVATPIGNLEDITLRALRVLNDVDLIACEDTRHTRGLLTRHAIRTPVVSYHEHNESRRTPELIDRLERGESVALVADAGTPLLSDPGAILLAAAAARGLSVVSIPGPSAVTAALAVAGFPADRFVFCGFLARRSAERRRALEALSTLPYTLVFFEAPHRIGKTLADLHAVLGSRPAAIVRELTKRFEEVLRGDLAGVIEQMSGRTPRGEFTIVVAGAGAQGMGPRRGGAGSIQPTDEAVRAHLETLLAGGVGPTAAAKIIARAHNVPRRTAYRLALQLRNQEPGTREV